jgi:peptide/nickel transport system substrate-binding protein
MATDVYSRMVNKNIFDFLFNVDTEDRRHGIASHWHFANDSLLVVKFRDDLRFSDGAKLHTNDIIRSFERALGSPVIRNHMYFYDIVAYDENTLHFLMPRRLSNNILRVMSFVPIYKASYIDMFDDEYLRVNPMGTAEYYLYSYEPTKIVLKKNIYHPDFSKNKTTPDIVELYLVDTFAEQFQQLKRRELDVILDVPYEDLIEATNLPDIRIVSTISKYITALYLDAMSEVTPFIDQPANPLKNKSVRHAIAHAIDIESYIEYRLFKKAHLLAIPALRSSKFYPVNMKRYTYDIDLSKKLLAEAGYPDGFKMALWSTAGPYSLALSDFIKNSLSNVGIEVDIEYFEGGHFFRELHANTPSAALMTRTFRSTTNSIFNHIRIEYRSIHNTPTLSNLMGYHCPRVIAIADSINDFHELDPLYSQLHERMFIAVNEEAMAIPFFQPYIFYAMCNSIRWDNVITFPIFIDMRVK